MTQHSTHQVQLTTTVEQAREAILSAVTRLTADDPGRAPTVGLVPTMGALHEGHGALLKQAREDNDLVIVSDFVNPLQFDQPEDYENYPRQLDEDLALVDSHGADILFAPDLDTMYPGWPDASQIRVSAGEMGRVFEGASRPGHFDGVCTVVTKLWNILMPPYPARFRSYFGQKDAQQLAILTRMARELNIPVEIVAVDLVRAPSGLALSSRNQRLDDEGRKHAEGLSTGLAFLAEQAAAGEVLDIATARQKVETDETVTLDYLEVVDPETLTPLSAEELSQPLTREALALVAAWVPPVRLIDNMRLKPSA